MKHKRPTQEELEQVEARAARVAMEAFMLTVREGIAPYGPEGKTGAVLEFFGGTKHMHSAFITGSQPGTLTFAFWFDAKPEAPLPTKTRVALELPLRCKVGPVLEALMMKDCPDAAVVVCVDAKDSQWVACGRPEHQKGAVKIEPVADWLQREGWLPGTSDNGEGPERQGSSGSR